MYPDECMKTHYLSTLPGGQGIARSCSSPQGGENELPMASKSLNYKEDFEALRRGGFTENEIEQ
jgi:hypothetical protein